MPKNVLPIAIACAELGPVSVVKALVEQLYLLSDHLCQPQQRCHDCIQKHFLTCEAFIEEGVRAYMMTQKPRRSDAMQRVMDRVLQAETHYLTLRAKGLPEIRLTDIAAEITALATDLQRCALQCPASDGKKLNDLSCTFSVDPVKRGLVPILSPNFNLRQCCKEMLWVQMLLNMRHRCSPCDRTKLKNAMLRHMAILHGLIEEAIALKVKGERRLVDNKALLKIVRQTNDVEQKIYSCDMNKATPQKIEQILQMIRRARKDLQPVVFGTVRLDRFGSKWPVMNLPMYKRARHKSKIKTPPRKHRDARRKPQSTTSGPKRLPPKRRLSPKRPSPKQPSKRRKLK